MRAHRSLTRNKVTIHSYQIKTKLPNQRNGESKDHEGCGVRWTLQGVHPRQASSYTYACLALILKHADVVDSGENLMTYIDCYFLLVVQDDRDIIVKVQATALCGS